MAVSVILNVILYCFYFVFCGLKGAALLGLILSGTDSWLSVSSLCCVDETEPASYARLKAETKPKTVICF